MSAAATQMCGAEHECVCFQGTSAGRLGSCNGCNKSLAVAGAGGPSSAKFGSSSLSAAAAAVAAAPAAAAAAAAADDASVAPRSAPGGEWDGAACETPVAACVSSGALPALHSSPSPPPAPASVAAGS